MSDINNSTDVEYYSGSDFTMSISVRFWLYLIPNVLSILCSLFVLYYLLFDRTLRQSLNNHVFIVLLFVGLIFELVDIPLTLHYYRIGTVWRLTPSFSLLWTYIDFVLYTTQIIIFAWATMERHILIFQYQWISTRRKRFLIHYLPLIILLTYVFVYCLIIIYFPPCKNLYFHSYINGVPVPCVLDKTIIAKYDLVCHQILPTFTIIISSIFLFIRVLHQKSRMKRPIPWRKQRKMAIQLLSISILYIFFNFPWTFLDLCFEIGLLAGDIYQIRSYAYFFSCYIIFLFPFVCCGSLPQLRKKLKKLLCYKQHRNIVVFQSLEMKPMVGTQLSQAKPIIY
jgi:hypothetical protein